jgi:hypothetical protein
MSAIDTALNTIDQVAREGDLTPERPSDLLELDALADPVVLPDGKRIYPPRLHGQPIDELACALIDTDRPAESTFLRLTGPPGCGKSQIARSIAHRLWRQRGRDVEDRHGVAFYGFVEIVGGPSSDEYLFRHEFVPAADDAGTVRLVDSAFVTAMREGWVVMIDEVNTIRDVALLSINSCLDGRLSLYLPATAQTVIAQPGFACLLAYNPCLVGGAATDIPDAWHSRFPATLEVTTNWPALATLGAPLQLVAEAMALDRQRIAGEDGLTWTPPIPRHPSARPDDRPRRRTRRHRVLRLKPRRATAGRQGPRRRGRRRLPDARPGRLRAPQGLSHTTGPQPPRLPPGGYHMTTAQARGGRPAVFVAQLHRAAAQRGKLDPVYQELSDHWTAIMQRLYPVWALIGPGLSDPGHIEIHSRQIYLDSDTLLRTREQITSGRLERRAVLRCFGVALHETFHAKHTKRWAIERDIALSDSETPEERQLAVDRRLLEEPRMEAHGVREHPPDTLRGRFVRHALQAAVTDVILPAFAKQLLATAIAGQPLTRDLAGRATVYLRARTHYGILNPAVLHGLRDVWRHVLGDRDLDALGALFARVIWIGDGELDALDRAAREYRAIIGPPDPSPADESGPAKSGDRPRSDGGENHDGDDRGQPAAGTLGDALEQALEQARDGQLEQLNENIDLQQVLDEAANRCERKASRGRGTGMPTGRMPDRGVDRPPAPDEVQHARRYATRLRQALTHGTRQIDKRTPGGRFNGRAYTRGQAQRQTGRLVTTHPWQITRQITAPIQEPHVGLVIDTSGSMGAYEYALGPICWILTDGLRQIAGRCATALFGNHVALLADGRRPLPLVPGIRTGGGTAFAGDAIELVCEQLEMTNPRRPRFLYVLSDGGWSDTQAGVARIRLLAEYDVPTIHVAIGIAPLSVECDRIHVISDPAQAQDQIAADTIAALRARAQPRRSTTTN